MWFALKTLKRNKRQTKFTILTITLTVTLFLSVLFIIDSTDSGYANYSRRKGGYQDFLLYHTLPNIGTDTENLKGLSDIEHFFDYEMISQEIRASISEKIRIFPRTQIYYKYGNNSGQMNAVNFSADWKEGIGPLKLISNPPTNLDFGLNESECIVENDIANQMGWILRSEISLRFPTFNTTVNYTVVGIIDEKNAYGSKNQPSIIINYDDLCQIHPDLQGKTNKVAIMIENYYDYYHRINQKETMGDLLDLGGNLLEQLGMDKWDIEYPNLFFFNKDKVLVLSFSFTSVYLGIGAVLFCGVLFYNYLSLSLNEKVREMGVLKVVGAKSFQLFLQNFLQGFLVSSIGTGIGIGGAVFIMKYLAFPFYNLIFGSNSFAVMVFSPSLNSFFFALSVGLFIPIIITIFLSLRVSKWSIVNTLNPDHYIELKTQTFSKTQKKILIIICGIIWLIFNFFFFNFLPTMFSNREYLSLFQFMSIVLYLLFISGAIFALKFSKPILNFLIRFLFREGSKFHEIIKIGVSKHTSKIKGTIILVIIFFANLVTVLSLIQSIGNQIYTRNQFEIGSNIKIDTKSGVSETFLKEDLSKLALISGVEVVTGMMIFPWEIETYYLNNYESMNISATDGIPSFSLQASDIDGVLEKDPDVFGIDDAFSSTIVKEQIIMSEGNAEEAFNQIHSNSSQNVLISTDLAVSLMVHLNDLLKLDFKRNSEIQSAIFHIVGIYESIPGILVSEPKYLEFSRNYGVVLSQNCLVDRFGLISGQQQYLNRILIKAGVESSETRVIKEIKGYFEIKSGSYRWINFVGIEEETQSEQEMFFYFKLISFFLFFILVFMALVGFLSSAYGLFLERQQEIKIYRALGLSIGDIQNLLLYEILLTFTVSGVIGTIIGFINSYIGSIAVSTLLNNNIRGKFIPPIGFIVLLFITSYFSILLLYQKIFKKKHDFSVIAWESYVKRGF